MSTVLQPLPSTEIVYPDSDGQPMADNTEQFDWIVSIKLGLELVFADNPDVFVAGDLLWYPVEGRPDIRIAPDAFVAFGRPKGRRGSYQQWKEGNIVPQVVFEVLSPGNRLAEMSKKLDFYDRYGVEEYYIINPMEKDACGRIRVEDRLTTIESLSGWVSPRLNVRFEITDDVYLYRPDGTPFESYLDIARSRDAARRDADDARKDADEARKDADEARQRAERLAEQLRKLGIDPDAASSNV